MSPALAPVTSPRRAPRHAPAARPEPRGSHLRVVPQAPAPRAPRLDRVAPVRASRRVAVFAAVGVLFAVLFAVVVLQTQNVAGQMNLDRVQQSISDRQAQAQSLRLEAASLASPDRIVAAAQDLGMATPAGGQIYVNQIPDTDAPVAPGLAATVDPSQLAAPEAEVSLDETAAGPAVVSATP